MIRDALEIAPISTFVPAVVSRRAAAVCALLRDEVPSTGDEDTPVLVVLAYLTDRATRRPTVRLRSRSWLLRTGAAALAAASIAGVLGAQASQATPSRDLDQVAAQVRDLQMQAGAAHERAEEARARLAGIQEKLGTITNRLERERREMRIMQGTIEDIARATYAGGGLDPTLQVLLAENPAEFLAQAAVMDQLQQAQVDQLRGAQTTRLRLAQTEAEISDSEAQAQQVRGEMASAEAEVSDRLAAAENVLADLQEEERQRLLQQERERRQQQLAAAREAAEVARQQAAAAAASAAAADDETSTGDSSGDSESTGAGPGGETGGSVDSGPAQSGGGYTGGSRAAAAVQYALSQVGDPYSFSASPPSSWDCSKLTAAAWGQAGVGLTALSYSQWDQTRRVPVSEIQPGDLVFYFGSGAHHVAIYVGNGKMVSASNPRDGVEIIDFLGPWYGERFSGVGRVVG
jgi:cell wall-associated NlpC family hydrolase